MFGNDMYDNKNKFHIVYGNKDKEWAILLYNLMGESKIEASISNEKIYNDQELKFSNENKIIFVGSSKIAKDNLAGTVWKYDEFGIKYGWIGNSAIISVENTNMDKEEFKKFCIFVDKTGKEINKEIEISKKNIDLGKSSKYFSVVGLVKPFVALSFAGATLLISVIDEKLDGKISEKIIPVSKEITDARWHIAIRLFFLDGLKQFSEV